MIPLFLGLTVALMAAYLVLAGLLMSRRRGWVQLFGWLCAVRALQGSLYLADYLSGLKSVSLPLFTLVMAAETFLVVGLAVHTWRREF